MNAKYVRATEHTRAADIQNIRNLLKGYGSSNSLLKEMIQNAIDANANRLVFAMVDGDKHAPHPLFQNQCLCIVNDGPFSPENQRAIFRMGAGTKTHDDQSIGRFGLGIKSLFHFCEAFFIHANPDRSLGWDFGEVHPYAYYNPAQGLRYQDWDDATELHANDVQRRIEDCVAALGSFEKYWFALWIPLRSKKHNSDSKLFIENHCPAEEADFFGKLVGQFTSVHASLFYTRNLTSISLVDHSSSGEPTVNWQCSNVRKPMSIECGGGQSPFHNEATWRREGHRSLGVHTHGVAGVLPEDLVAHVKSQLPSATTVSADEQEVTQDAKGIPHYAVAISQTDSDDAALSVVWSVFLPVGEQPPVETRAPLPKSLGSIRITLHGYYFLDSERRRIDGLDRAFEMQADDSIGSKWNELLSREGTLAALPQAVEAFCQGRHLSADDCFAIARAIKRTWIWSRFQKKICRTFCWLPCLKSSRIEWKLVSSSTVVYRVPAVENLQDLVESLPGLTALLDSKYIVQHSESHVADYSGLSTGTTQPLGQIDLESILKRIDCGSELPTAVYLWIDRLLQGLTGLTGTLKAIVEKIPLIPVKCFRTGVSKRKSAEECSKLESAGVLFKRFEPDGIGWCRSLLDAIPGLDLFEYEQSDYRPQWLRTLQFRVLDSLTAQKIVLEAKSLGPLEKRCVLVEQFRSDASSINTVRAAMRYLMHGHYDLRHDVEATLFVGALSESEHIWTKLTEEFLSQSPHASKWRLIDKRWAESFASNVLNSLGIRTIDAEGSLEELLSPSTDVSKLSFRQDRWSAGELGQLIQGLYTAGSDAQDRTKRILRQLAIHSKRGSSERISIGCDRGELLPTLFLDDPVFQREVPEEVEKEWQCWLMQVGIIDRIPEAHAGSYQQRELFRHGNPGAINSLSWPAITRSCLNMAAPSRFTLLILHAFSKVGDQAAAGNGDQLKKVPWLRQVGEGQTCLSDVLQIDGIEDEIAVILDPGKTGFCGLHSIESNVRSHPGFASVRKYMPSKDESFGFLADLLNKLPSWHIGLTQAVAFERFRELVEQLRAKANLPGARLICKVLERAEGSTQVAALTERFLYPSLAHPFSEESESYTERVRVLRALATTETLDAFNLYLKQAVIDGVWQEVIPKIKLLSASNQWIDACDLVWPCDNIENSIQLHSKQVAILNGSRHRREAHDIVSRDTPTAHELAGIQRLEQRPDLDDEARRLAQFLEPFIERFGENLPAALVVAVSGSEPIRKLLSQLLESSYAGAVDDFIDNLLGDVEAPLKLSIGERKFLFEISNEDTVELETLTGEKKIVDLSASINSLIVGEPRRLALNHYYIDGSQREAYRVVLLRKISTIEESFKATPVFARTIDHILLEAHCNGDSRLCPTNIEDGLERLSDTSQTRLRTSQLALLQTAHERIASLGLRDAAPFDAICELYDEAANRKVAVLERREINSSATEVKAREAEVIEAKALRSLEVVLKGADVQPLKLLTDALREKLLDYEYDINSIPNELFQNADDAASELQNVCKHGSPASAHFFMHLNSADRLLRFIHWGRPINKFKYPGFDKGRELGFADDVRKMLTLGHSDKHRRRGENLTNATGRFGLGFKSVFFISDAPKIVSDSLGFEIRGGFFPVSLPVPEITRLKAAARNIQTVSAPVTVVELPYREPEALDAGRIETMVGKFCASAEMLCLFARVVRTINVLDGERSMRWSLKRKTILGLRAPVLCEVSGPEKTNQYLAIECPTAGDSRPAVIAFRIGVNGPEAVPEEAAGVWSTAKLGQTSALRFAVNGPFKPDAGRQSLAFASNDENLRAAKQFAVGWGTGLVELFDYLECNFDSWAVSTGMHASVTKVRFWHQLATLVAFLPAVRDWEKVRDGDSMVGWMAFSRDHGAMLRLFSERRAISTDLPGTYGAMIRLQEAEFVVQGALSDNAEWLEALGAFPRVTAQFPPGTVVSASTGKLIGKLTPSRDNGVDAQEARSIRSIRLVDILRSFAINDEVSPDEASDLGKWMIAKKPFDQLSLTNRDDFALLESWLRSLRFVTQSGEFRVASELVSCHEELWADTDVSEDEILRARFAPRECVLSEQYDKDGVALFAFARAKLDADVNALATWIGRASQSQMYDVFQYLLYGKLRERLAECLASAWLIEHQSCPEFTELDEPDQEELKRIFAEKGRYTIQLHGGGFYQHPLPAYALTPKQAFTKISNWWKDIGPNLVEQYESSTYPQGYPGQLPWPSEDEWEIEQNRAGWLLLFVQGALSSLGFNRVGRDLGFTQFLAEGGWLNLLMKSATQPQSIQTAVEQYMDEFVQHTRFHFQMRQFVAYLVAAQNLEAFVESLRDADQAEDSAGFYHAFTPRSNLNLEGTGIDAPPIADMLGVGSGFIIRELYRKGRLTSVAGYPFAFFAVRRVRKLCESVFHVPELKWFESTHAISERLKSFGGDPTFGLCFDLPLLYLASDHALRQAVLGAELEFDTDDFEGEEA